MNTRMAALKRPKDPNESGPCVQRCKTQCDGCHTIWHCQEASITAGELLLCGECWLRLANGDTLARIHHDWPHQGPRS